MNESKIFKIINPKSPSMRHLFQLKVNNITNKKLLLKNKIMNKQRLNGRNNQGKITVYHKGGGHKKKYRMLDFSRNNESINIIVSIEYDPIRTANICALFNVFTGCYSYIISPKNVQVGNIVKSGNSLSEIKLGYSLPLKNIPIGSLIHNLSFKVRSKSKCTRSAGTLAKVVKKDLNYALIKLSSGKLKLLNNECFATLGIVSNQYHFLKTLGKAGRARWLNRRPTVRGVAMNPIDHPNGGGEGKSSGYRISPWGKVQNSRKNNKRHF